MELSRETLREEVINFRSTLQIETLDAAEKSITLKKQGKVGWILLDQDKSKANKLSTPNMLRLFDLFLEVEKDSDIGCLVFISKKPTIFIAGADIAEIKQLATAGQGAADSLMKLQSVFTYLENLPIPTVAAVHGACLGGGMELSLACDYRIVTDAPETRIGLPEVMLGLLPGWGGTQRLPRLVGLEKSLDLILSGRHLSGKAAHRMGYADRLVPKEILEEKAFAFATELSETRKKRKAKGLTFKKRIIETVPGGKSIIFDQAKKKVLEKTKGNYPAPLKAIEVIQETYRKKSIGEGLKIEAQAFAELVITSESKNLIEIFYLTEKVKKDKGTETEIRGKKIQRAGVLGAGVMGGGIAQLFVAKGIRTRMKDIQWDAIAKGYKAAHSIFYKRVKRRKMKQYELDNAMSLIEGTTTYSGFKQLDLVVEAVVENMDLKKKVFAELEANTKPDAILATNTSSLSVTEMASATKDPSRVAGMHFFNPVHKMPLVEIIRGEKSSDEAVATVFQLAKKLGKTPIVVKDAPGFVVNRILGPYLNEAVYLLSEGVGIEELDTQMEKFGMPMGPCALLDEVGLDVAAKVSKILFGAFGERMKPHSFMGSVIEQGFLGKKSGKGIFIYQDDGKKKIEHTHLMSQLKPKARESHLTDEAVERRMIYLMINEAARILDEGLVRDVSDIDIGMIFGTGFAPFRGGLLRFADTVGAESIVGDLELFTRNYGPRFQPCNYLQQLAVSKRKFYE